MTAVYETSPPGIPIPPPVVYVAAFGCGLLAEIATPSPELPARARAGGALGGIALLLTFDTRAMLRFRRHGTPFNPARPAQALVTDGPYRVTRNPMYVGMAGAYAGAALAAGKLWPLALLPGVLWAIDRTVVRKEEAHLADRFGEDYERYRRQVPRWL